jgi:hypothetical protein
MAAPRTAVARVAPRQRPRVKLRTARPVQRTTKQQFANQYRAAGGKQPVSGAVGPAPPPPQQKPPPQTYDYSNDPILQGVYRRGEADTRLAQQQAIDARKQLLLGYGSQEMARKYLGANDPFVATVSDDPATSFSALANIARQYNTGVVNLGNQVNALGQNTWWGSAHGSGLADLAVARMQDQATQEQQFNQGWQGISNDLTGALRDVENTKLGAEQAAYQRAIDEQQQFNYGVMPQNLPPTMMSKAQWLKGPRKSGTYAAYSRWYRGRYG